MTPQPTERVVDALIGAHLVDPSAREASIVVVADALESRTHSPSTQRRGLPKLVEVVAYLGGALVLAAVSLFVVQQWDDLDFGAQVGLLAVATVALLVAGVGTTRVPSGGAALRDGANDVRRRLAGSLLTFTSLTAATLVGLVLDRARGATDFYDVDWVAAAFGVVLVVVAAIGYRLAPTAVGLVAILGGAVTVVVSLLEGVDHNAGDVTGVALLLLGAVWLGVTEMGWFRESTVARALGLTLALVGAQVPVMDGTHSGLGYVLTAVVAGVGIGLYLAKLAWPYLAAAVIAVTLVVPEAVWDWTGGSLGAAGGVLVAGITLLGASFVGYRLRAEATD